VTSSSAQFLRSRIGKVCVAIIGANVAEMIEKATVAIKETPFLEFRLDYLEKPALALPKLKHFLADNTAVTAIATCRRTKNGGKFSGALAAELDILLKSAAAGFHLVDLGIESAESLKKSEIQKLRDTGVALLASARRDQLAAVIPRLGHGAFTYVVLEGLSGKAATRSGRVTAGDILSYSTSQLPSLTKSQANFMQIPVAYRRGEDFSIAR